MSNKLIKAAYAQTREDDRSIEIQTDKMVKASKVCQWPEDMGGFSSTSNRDQFQEIDFDRLHSFLHRSAQVCRRLLSLSFVLFHASPYLNIARYLETEYQNLQRISIFSSFYIHTPDTGVRGSLGGKSSTLSPKLCSF
jgi:hypothetical protein